MKYRACLEYDAVTETCTSEQWVDSIALTLDPAFFPNLSVGEVYSILSAVAVVYAIAWGWKFITNAIVNKR